MSKKPLSKQGPLSDIKNMEQDWTALTVILNSIADLIFNDLNTAFNNITGDTDKNPIF